VRRQKLLADQQEGDSLEVFQAAQLEAYADYVCEQAKKEQTYFENAIELVWGALDVS
jgi:hypothetical protein